MAWFNDPKRHSLARRGIKTAQKVNPISKLDISRYSGKWFEISRTPNWFQEGCKKSIAEYSKKEGYIEVKNSCEKDGERTFRFAKAQQVGKSGKLEVSFFPFVKADYLVLFTDYNTALVGTPDRNYLWVLSRTRELPKYKVDKLTKIAQKQGFDVEKLK